MTEMKAIFGPPALDGKKDGENFVSEDPKFLRWCLDFSTTIRIRVNQS
jgi:hypothetical protein